MSTSIVEIVIYNGRRYVIFPKSETRQISLYCSSLQSSSELVSTVDSEEILPEHSSDLYLVSGSPAQKYNFIQADLRNLTKKSNLSKYAMRDVGVLPGVLVVQVPSLILVS